MRAQASTRASKTGEEQKENRYVIKVIRFKQGRGYGSRGSAGPKDVPSHFIGHN